MSFDPFVDPLDALFADAMRSEARFPSRPTMKAAKPEPVKPVSTLERYSLPENWLQRRGLALIHRESNTLLGNFVEYVHRTEHGARKLIRSDSPIEITGIEHVSGPQWLFAAADIPAPERADSTRELLLDLTLASLGVSAAAVGLRVCFQYGGIIRVELRQHTTFHSPDGHTVLTIAAGTNIYTCMDLQAKIDLRKELQA